MHKSRDQVLLKVNLVQNLPNVSRQKFNSYACGVSSQDSKKNISSRMLKERSSFGLSAGTQSHEDGFLDMLDQKTMDSCEKLKEKTSLVFAKFSQHKSVS